MTNFRTLSIGLAALSIALIASTGYLAISPGAMTRTPSTPASTVTQIEAQSVAGYTVNLAYKSSLNTYLTNGSGWTLYLFTNDTQNSGASSCYGGCASFWPAFHGSVSSLVLPPGLNSSSFGNIRRTDGTVQLTYQGWPLYTFAGDKSVGDTNGQGKFGTWFVLNIPVLNTPKGSTTTMSTTPTGRNAGY